LIFNYEVLFLRLEPVQQPVQLGRGLTVVSDDDARSTNNLTSIAGLIALAQTSPFAQLHRIVDLQKLDVVGLAQSFDELDVFTLLAILSQEAKVSFLSVEGFNALTETTSETIVDQRLFKDGLKGGVNVHFSTNGLGNHISL
jgi:hypothetical protein